MTTPKDVRAQLIDALRLDLVGPRTGHAPHDRYAEEVLPIAPSKWYLTGFLVPYEAPASQRADDGRVRAALGESVGPNAGRHRESYASPLFASYLGAKSANPWPRGVG